MSWCTSFGPAYIAHKVKINIVLRVLLNIFILYDAFLELLDRICESWKFVFLSRKGGIWFILYDGDVVDIRKVFLLTLIFRP
jgi:hypothetical protein